MLIRRAALILRGQAFVFFALSVTLLMRPSLAVHFLGFSARHDTPELLWAIRLIGALLLLPALLAPLVAAFAGERGLRQAASGMAFFSAVVGTVSLTCPIGFTLATVGVSAIWYLFTLLYVYALRGRGRNR